MRRPYAVDPGDGRARGRGHPRPGEEIWRRVYVEVGRRIGEAGDVRACQHVLPQRRIPTHARVANNVAARLVHKHAHLSSPADSVGTPEDSEVLWIAIAGVDEAGHDVPAGGSGF